MLHQVGTEAENLNAPWLLLDQNYALASILIQAGRSREAVSVCEKALAQAEKLQSKLYQFRFHAIAGQAFRALKNEERASEHIRAAQTLFSELADPLKAEFAESLRKSPEAAFLK
jgi:hypothetical protein